MTASQWTLTAIVIAGAAILGLAGPRISAAILRARWAWRCRGHPVPPDGDTLSFDEIRALNGISKERSQA